jgi:hypothetical protein
MPSSVEPGTSARVTSSIAEIAFYGSTTSTIVVTTCQRVGDGLRAVGPQIYRPTDLSYVGEAVGSIVNWHLGCGVGLAEDESCL